MAAKKTRAKTPQKGVVALVPDGKPTSTPTRQKRPRTPPKKSKTKTATPPRRRTWKGWFFSLILKFSFVYYLYQYVATCPKDGTDERRVCEIGDRVLDFVEPYAYDIYDEYIDPYYAEYLEPYVEKATPYVILANKNYVQPAGAYALQQFDIHGKPQIEKAKAKALAEYTRVLEPHVKDLTTKGQGYYNDYLADHVATGQEIYVAYYPVVEKQAIQAYGYSMEKAYPYYLAALPYIQKAWAQGLETAGWLSVEGKVWIVRRWGMHVEPQIGRIQERLGLKIKNGTPVKDGSPTPPLNSNPNASSSDTAPDSKIKADIEGETKANEELSPEEAVKKAEADAKAAKRAASKASIAAARPIVEADLAEWHAKFEEAGVKAGEEVVTKLDTLCEKVLKEQDEPSEELIKSLETVIEKEFETFEGRLKILLESPAEDQYVMIGFNNMMGQIFGNVKKKQETITAHTQSFLMDTYQNTAKIVDAALATMDSVLDLGMQELGMKWAWTDGITAKDWAKYHELKKDFGAIKTKVIRAGQGHKKLREVTDYAKSIDDSAAEVVKYAHTEFESLEKIAREKVENRAKVEIQEELPAQPSSEAQSEPVVQQEETRPEIKMPGGKADPRPYKPADSEPVTSDGDSSPVDEIENVKIDNKGQVVEEHATNAAEPAVEEPSLKSEKQSQKEDVIAEEKKAGDLIPEPDASAAQKEKIVQKDEL